jgi:hypothetical protein
MAKKTFMYERTPSASWKIDEVLLAVCYDCFDSYACKQYIRTAIMEPLNFKVDTAYAVDFNHYGNNDTVKHYIQHNGGVGIVNYRGHGGSDRWLNWAWYPAWQSFTNSDVSSLNNFWYPDSAWLPLVFNFCCNTGNITSPECMIEAWTRNPIGGAVGALGATGETWWQVSNPMDTVLFRTMFDPEDLPVDFVTYDIGKAVNYAKVWVVENPPSGVTMDQILKVVYRHLWAGDPSLWVWTDSQGQVATLTVSHPRRIETEPTQFRVTVEDGAGGTNTPVQGALVCLYKKEAVALDLYERGFTDSNGQITFNIDPATAGILSVSYTHLTLPTTPYV